MLQTGSSVCICCQVSYEPFSNLTGSPSELEMNTDSQHLPFPVSQLPDIRQKGEQKVDGSEWWGLCLNPSKWTRASLPLREITFSSLSPKPLSSLEKCLRDFMNQRWLRLDCYIKCLHSFLICCRLSLTDFQMLLNSLLSALTLFALCTKNSSLMTIFALLLAFALLFAVDPPRSTTDDA